MLLAIVEQAALLGRADQMPRRRPRLQSSSRIQLAYPPDTCAELCWMGVHGPGGRADPETDFAWSDREVLIKGMLDIHVKGVVRSG